MYLIYDGFPDCYTWSLTIAELMFTFLALAGIIWLAVVVLGLGSVRADLLSLSVPVAYITVATVEIASSATGRILRFQTFRRSLLSASSVLNSQKLPRNRVRIVNFRKCLLKFHSYVVKLNSKWLRGKVLRISNFWCNGINGGIEL